MNEQDSLQNKVGKWIKGQGYPLEMAVANALHSAGFDVSLSDLYNDPETNEQREIDVVASTRTYPKGSFVFEMNYCIECKTSSDKPWILFTDSPYYRFSSPADTLQSNLWRRLLQNDYMDKNGLEGQLKNLHFFQGNFVGYGLTQAFTSGQDVCYKAALSAVKSSESFIRHFDNSVKSKSMSFTSLYIVGVAIPVIIIDCPLFVSWLSDNGDLGVHEVDRAVVRWKRTTSGQPCDIHLITKPAIESFVQDAVEICALSKAYALKKSETLAVAAKEEKLITRHRSFFSSFLRRLD